MTQRKSSNSPFTGIIAVVFIAFMVWLVFNFVKGLFSILAFLALPLFVLAIILNYRVVTDYFKWLWKLIKTDTGKGILFSIGSVIGYPLVSAWLFFKAFTTRKSSTKKKKSHDYLKYEEVDEDEDFLELPDVDKYKVKETKPDNKYDDLF